MYPCVICVEECSEDAIQCSDCEKWVHSKCVPMSNELLVSWLDANLKFLCRDCCCIGDEFDTAGCLQRLKESIGNRPRESKVMARCEKLLLDTYNIKFPQESSLPSGRLTVDKVSKEILKVFHPVILQDVYPAFTNGDGNCLYRAISKALSGSEEHYSLLRVLTLLEVLQNPSFYDVAHVRFVDLIKDSRILVSGYSQLCTDIATLGSFADMMHIYAISAVIKMPIRSYYPPHLSNEFLSEPYSRKVVGRGVNESDIPAVTVMWTQCNWIPCSVFRPNHFVPLIPLRCQPPAEIIDVDQISMELEENYDTEYRHITNNEDDDDMQSFVADDEAHALANGRLENTSFLDANQLVHQLSTTAFAEAHTAIPTGTKNNVYFVIKNDENFSKRTKGLRSEFSDDCGIWDSASGATPKTLYLKTDTNLKNIFYRDNKYCYLKKEEGKRKYIPYDPQPDLESVIEVFRYYTTLKKDKEYKKRISWLGLGKKENVAVVEYSGSFPGLSSHRNAKKKEDYIRTPSLVMTEMSNLLKTNKPINVYKKLTLKHDVLAGPSSRKQVHDRKYRDKRKQHQQDNGQVIRKGNIADHLKEIEKQLADKNSLVKSVVRDQGRAPSVILYTEEQLLDLKNICCTGKSVLGVDKTFNLCDMHVTATCYKQIAVIMEDTKEPPIFLGPVFLHDNSDFKSFSNFFNHLRIQLWETNTEQLVIGSDEEGGLVNAITTAFPDASHVLCTRHIKQNVKQKLIDDGIDKKQSIDWKSQHLLDLIHKLGDIIETQFKDVRRALVNIGQYRLAEHYRHFAISKTLWISKTDQERDRLYKRLRNYNPKDKDTVTSSDGQTTVVKPRSHGKKIGQRKRKTNERTINLKYSRSRIEEVND